MAYSIGQRKEAKQRGVPLVTIDFDARHVVGSKVGRMSISGPLDSAMAEAVLATLNSSTRKKKSAKSVAATKRTNGRRRAK